MRSRPHLPTRPGARPDKRQRRCLMEAAAPRIVENRSSRDQCGRKGEVASRLGRLLRRPAAPSRLEVMVERSMH